MINTDVLDAIKRIEAARDEALAAIRDAVNIGPIVMSGEVTPEQIAALRAAPRITGHVHIIDSADDNARIERDRLIYGTGFGKLRADGTLEHVPAPDVLVFPRDTAESTAAVEQQLEDDARAEVGRELGLNRAPTWQDVVSAMRPFVIKGTVSPERLAALRAARSTVQSVIIDSEDQAMRLFSDDRAEISAAVEARALELYAEHCERRGFGSGTKLSDQVRAAIQAIVELIAQGDR